jgi:hypothetical protein
LTVKGRGERGEERKKGARGRGARGERIPCTLGTQSITFDSVELKVLLPQPLNTKLISCPLPLNTKLTSCPLPLAPCPSTLKTLKLLKLLKKIIKTLKRL